MYQKRDLQLDNYSWWWGWGFNRNFLRETKRYFYEWDISQRVCRWGYGFETVLLRPRKVNILLVTTAVRKYVSLPVAFSDGFRHGAPLCRLRSTLETNARTTRRLRGFASGYTRRSCSTLLDIVPRVERNVFVVKENCKQPKDGLTSDESASIMLYTLESNPHKSSLYVILNDTLRSEQRQKLKPWFLYLRLILTALTRLPSERRSVFRGVREDLQGQYSMGSIFIWWSFSSCTSSVGVLECESFFGQSGTRTLFHIECLSGKDIKNHSFMQQEDEILLLPARQLVVTSVLNSGNDLHIIQLKETQPKFPLLEPVSLTTATFPYKKFDAGLSEAQKPTSSKQTILALYLSGQYQSWGKGEGEGNVLQSNYFLRMAYNPYLAAYPWPSGSLESTVIRL